jgi:hypothetical protein
VGWGNCRSWASALAAGAGLFGATETRDKLLAAAKERETELERTNPQLYESFTEHPFGYFMERGGEQIPNVGLMIGTGGGATLGRGALGLFGRAAAKEALEASALKLGSQEAAEAAAAAAARKGTERAFQAGAGLGSYTLQAGENYGDYVDRYGVEKASPAAALGWALPQAALDVGAVERIGHMFMPKPANLWGLTEAQLARQAGRGGIGAMARGAGAGMAKASLYEGSTEATQEALKRLGGSTSQYGDLREFNDPRTWSDIGEAGLVGAMVGGVPGGIGGAYGGLRNRGAPQAEIERRAAVADPNSNQFIGPQLTLDEVHGPQPGGFMGPQPGGFVGPARPPGPAGTPQGNLP